MPHPDGDSYCLLLQRVESTLAVIPCISPHYSPTAWPSSVSSLKEKFLACNRMSFHPPSTIWLLTQAYLPLGGFSFLLLAVLTLAFSLPISLNEEPSKMALNQSIHMQNRHKLRFRGFTGGSLIKNLPANAGDVCSIPRSGWPPGEGNGNPLQYSCLENPMDRGAWQGSQGLQESDTP